jgi:hypothetical protein
MCISTVLKQVVIRRGQAVERKRFDKNPFFLKYKLNVVSIL